MSDNYQRRLSRRDAIKLMGALSASVAMVGCVYPDVDDSDLLAGEWPELDLPPLPGPGYGTDPILVNPEPAPWKLSLTQAQLNLAAELAEAICPGAIEAGVPDVLNEWLSAPYPKQADDRKLLLAGFAWLDQRCRTQFDVDFAGLSAGPREQLLASLDQAPEHLPPDLVMPAKFFDRTRSLVAGAYYSSPRGVQELGYQGNTPISGDYPGPSDEAMAHLQGLLDELGLEL